MIVLVCGSRNWKNKQIIYDALVKLHDHSVTTIIEGEAKGADLLAREAALKLGIEVIGVPAVWEKYGKAAGTIRNRRMLEIMMPDLVLAFHEDFNNSKGTGDMVKVAKKNKIPVIVINDQNKTIMKIDKEGNEHVSSVVV